VASFRESLQPVMTADIAAHATIFHAPRKMIASFDMVPPPRAGISSRLTRPSIVAVPAIEFQPLS
jgi:hypothetical protein